MYEGGKDVEQDFQEAFRLFRGAARVGHAEAIKVLALCSFPPPLMFPEGTVLSFASLSYFLLGASFGALPLGKLTLGTIVLC
jgi:TPR repeat protein